MSAPQGPVQHSAQTGQHERDGESSTAAAAAVFVHSLVIVIMSVVGETAGTHS